MENKVPEIRFKGFNEEWEKHKFNDVFDFLQNNTLSRANLSEEKGKGKIMNVHYGDILVKFGEVIDISTETLPYIIDESIVNKYATSLLQNGDIIIADTAEDETVGKCSEIKGLQEQKALAGLHTIPIRPKEQFSNGYLGYYMNSNAYHNQLLPLIQGTKVSSISKSAIQDTFIAFPKSLEEQQKIADYFTNFDNIINLHQQKCDAFKKLKKAYLNKMFPKNDELVPEIRFAGFTDAWEQRKLSELIIEYRETVDSDCTLPVLTSSKTEGVLLQEEHFGNKQNHDISGYNILPRNYCTYRNRSDGTDFTFNINRCCDKGIISKFYPVFYGNNSDIFFISLVLNNVEEVIREIAYTCKGTGQKVLSFLDLQKMEIKVPSYEEQKKIGDFFLNLDNTITLHQRKCEALKKLKKAMLQQMFV